MNTSDYRIVFDVTNVGFKSWGFSAFGLIFVAIGVALPTIMKVQIFGQQPAFKIKWFPRLFLGFAVIWTVATFSFTYFDYLRAIRAMRSNQAETVVGRVNRFKPMPFSGHAMESFAVNGVEFYYSDYAVTAGFNNTASHGGPIREGLPVKIWYLAGEILRLDVENVPNQSPDPAPAPGMPPAGHESRHG